MKYRQIIIIIIFLLFPISLYAIEALEYYPVQTLYNEAGDTETNNYITPGYTFSPSPNPSLPANASFVATPGGYAKKSFTVYYLDIYAKIKGNDGACSIQKVKATSLSGKCNPTLNFSTTHPDLGPSSCCPDDQLENPDGTCGCPEGESLINGVCTPCPSGYVDEYGGEGNDFCVPECPHGVYNAPVGFYGPGMECVQPPCGSCEIELNNVCVPNNEINETFYNDGSCGPTICPDGSEMPITGVCPEPPELCPDGSIMPESGNCPVVCPDGSTVPFGQECPPLDCWELRNACIQGCGDIGVLSFGCNSSGYSPCVCNPTLTPPDTTVDPGKPLDSTGTGTVSITNPDGSSTTTTTTTNVQGGDKYTTVTTTDYDSNGNEIGSSTVTSKETGDGLGGDGDGDDSEEEEQPFTGVDQTENGVNYEPILSSVDGITSKFPVSLITGITGAFSDLVGDGSAPQWTFPILDWEMTIDLSPFDNLALMVKWFLGLYIFVIGTKYILFKIWMRS